MQVAIIGAGIAGLTLAKRLSESGIKTIVIEREDTVGGLARSFQYANGATYDIGPHRFHTDDPKVSQFVMETLGEDHLVIDRNSQLFLFGNYLNWPLTFRDIRALPLHLFLRCGIDLLVRRRAQTESFEDYIIEKYGHTLYKVFFKPYTERFLEYKCSNLHRDWATAGINRATIDKKLDTGSLAALVRSVLFSIPVKTKFIYPQSGGIGVFSEKLASGIRNHGATIFLSTQVSEFVTEDRNIRAIKTNTGKEIPVGHVFWSGSLTSLRSLDHSGAGVPRLHYMSSVFYNYFIGRQINNGFQWCYFGDPGIEIDRISVPRNFNPALVPPGKEGLCIEVCCTEESSTWKDPARLDSVLETFLVRARLLSSLDHIEGYHVERVRETYPLYVLNYPRKLKSYFEWVNTTWHNLTLVGRTGRFWYNNMDNSIAASLDTAERFLAGYRKGVLPHGDAYSVEDRYLKGMTPSP